MSESCRHNGRTSCTVPSSEQVQDLLLQAEKLCAGRQQRFTELRRKVLELVCQYKQPVGAYDLLDDLKQTGRSAAPPTVYRALDFLQSQGLVHRLATNNTYIACAHPQHEHTGLFFVCHRCGFTQEVHTDEIVQAVRQQAVTLDFTVEKAAVEVSGTCHDCQSGNDDV